MYLLICCQQFSNANFLSHFEWLFPVCGNILDIKVSWWLICAQTIVCAQINHHETLISKDATSQRQKIPRLWVAIFSNWVYKQTKLLHMKFNCNCKLNKGRNITFIVSAKNHFRDKKNQWLFPTTSWTFSFSSTFPWPSFNSQAYPGFHIFLIKRRSCN